MKRRRRRDSKLADLLHLLADGPHEECSNKFSPNGIKPEAFAALWAEHGERILAQWAQTGHRPSDWWAWRAWKAGIRIEGLTRDPTKAT